MSRKTWEPKDFWRNILGFQPYKQFEVHEVEHRSYCDCDETEYFEDIPSPPWTAIRRCNHCRVYTYIVFQDRMGTVAPDNVCIDTRISNMDMESVGKTMDSVWSEVRQERFKQISKWGLQRHTPVEWIAILTEELGEAAKEAVDLWFENGTQGLTAKEYKDLEKKRTLNYRKELVQVAAVAVQMIEDFDQQYKNFKE